MKYIDFKGLKYYDKLLKNYIVQKSSKYLYQSSVLNEYFLNKQIKSQIFNLGQSPCNQTIQLQGNGTDFLIIEGFVLSSGICIPAYFKQTNIANTWTVNAYVTSDMQNIDTNWYCIVKYIDLNLDDDIWT